MVNPPKKLTIPKIIAELKETSIPFCIWKNLHERDLMIAGKTDVDLHVPIRYKTAFEAFYHSLGGVRVRSTVQNPPGIVHVFFPGQDAKILHLHVYYMLFTGESHLKDFMLPISDILINSRKPDSDLGFVIAPEVENLIAILRYYLKVSSLMGLVLYWRESADYAKQKARINFDAGLPEQCPVLGQYDAMQLLSRIKSESIFRSFITGKQLRRQLRGLRRFGPLQAFLTSYAIIAGHLVNRLIRKEKKTLPHFGRFVALTGPDGAGKTTVLGGLESIFCKKLTVRHVHFGRPPANLLTAPLHGILALRRRIKGSGDGMPLTTPDPAKLGLIAAVRYVALAYDRNKLARRVMRDLCRGYLVLSDRFPSQNIGKMDSPKLDPNRSKSELIRRLAIIEHRYYDAMIQPNMLIEFSVSEDIAIARNRTRIKDFKETDAEIIQRLRDNTGLSFRADIHIVFENNEDVCTAIQKLFYQIWTSIR